MTVATRGNGRAGKAGSEIKEEEGSNAVMAKPEEKPLLVSDQNVKKTSSEPSSAAIAYQAPPSDLFCFLAALAYGITSLLMVFLNKGVLMTYKYSMTVLTLQMFVSAILIPACARLGVIQIRPFNWATARSLLPLAFFYNANVAFALASLEGVNVPMYIALKRLTPMAILIVNFFSGKAKPPLQVTLSVTLTVIGCFIAALGDFSFNPWGYSLGLTSVVCQTAYLVLVERSGAEDGHSTFELLLYNAVLSLPVLSFIILATGEAWVSFPLLVEKMSESLGFSISFVLSLVMAIVLNFTMFLCTIVNSALTTTIVGVLKGVGTTILGFFVLGGVEFRFLNVTGLTINTIGGIWYSLAKYLQKHRPNPSTKSSKEMEPLLPTSTNPVPAHPG